ncbi:MAG: hypothetical protein HY082_04195 [Gammaproteobacteria bacterium]|nr:hypothetical protein [Gammaproteobacteria bacterium]MBI5783438.1 hypothetical protein [Gammaproteobacteria bacterium]
MRNHFIPVCTVLILALPVTVAYADVGVNLKAGTLGAGVELSKGLSDKFSVSLGFNTYNYKTSDTTSDISYDFKFELQSAALLANYHPFSGVFRLTGGVLYDNNELSLTGKPSGANYTINGVTYSSSAVGNLTGKLTFNKTAPYLGIGWGNRPNSRFGLSADIGALYQGSPKLSLSATGALSDPVLAADLERERASAESDLSKYKWYPVLSLGMYFRF